MLVMVVSNASFNAEFVFTIVWIPVVPSFEAKMYLKIRYSHFFYNDQEVGLILLALLLKCYFAYIQNGSNHTDALTRCSL